MPPTGAPCPTPPISTSIAVRNERRWPANGEPPSSAGAAGAVPDARRSLARPGPYARRAGCGLPPARPSRGRGLPAAPPRTAKLFRPSGTVGGSRKGPVRDARCARNGAARRAPRSPLAHSLRDTPTTRAVQWVNPLPSATRRAHDVPRMRRSPVVRGRNPADGDHVATAIR